MTEDEKDYHYHLKINEIFQGLKVNHKNIAKGIFEYWINKNHRLNILSFNKIEIINITTDNSWGDSIYLFRFEDSCEYEKNIDDMIIFKELILPKYL